MRALAADDQAGALRPGVERELIGEFGHPGALARLPVAVDRRPPRPLGQPQYRLAHPLVHRVAEREAHVGLAASVGQRVAGAGRVRARENRAVQRLRRELLERQLEQFDVIGGVVGAGVAGAQDRSQDPPARRSPAAG